MTLPRRLVPGTTWFGSRRAVNRLFLFNPDARRLLDAIVVAAAAAINVFASASDEPLIEVGKPSRLHGSWEDDPVQVNDPAYDGGANGVSLELARVNYAAFGACDEQSLKDVQGAVMVVDEAFQLAEEALVLQPHLRTIDLLTLFQNLRPCNS